MVHETARTRGKMREVVRFISAHGTVFFFAYLVGSMWPVFVIESEFNAPFLIAFKFLSLPIIAVCWGIGLKYQDIFLLHAKSRAAYWIGMIVFPALAVLWSGGIVLGANALLPPQSEFALTGQISRKFISGAKSKSHHLDIQTPHGTKKVEVSPEEYQRAEIGMYFSQTRQHGPFGFSYVWKFKKTAPRIENTHPE